MIMKKTVAIMIALIMVLMSSISVFADENNGGTIYWVDNDSPIDASFTNNTNPYNGGTIYWDGNGSPVDAPFTNNTNPYNGGTIYFN